MVSIGATFQIHRCSGHILWSVASEEPIHDACSLCCHTDQAGHDHKNSCQDGDCEDVVLKFDQLSDKFFSFAKDPVQSLSPAIIIIPWIQEILSFAFFSKEIIQETNVLAYANSSPPVYLANCIFRI